MSKWLTLSKNTTGPRYIVDENGRAKHLFGMGYGNYHYYEHERPFFGGAEGFARAYQERGCNIVRYAIYFSRNMNQLVNYLELCGGCNEAGINRFIDEYVDPDIQAIIKTGSYVMLDLHDYPFVTPQRDLMDALMSFCGFDMPLEETLAAIRKYYEGRMNGWPPSKIIEFARNVYIPIWRELAKQYKDEPMIAVYELWNEPFPADHMSLGMDDQGIVHQGSDAGYDWNGELRKFYIDCIAEIRKYDKKHVVLVSDWNAGWGCAWTTTWAEHMKEIDPECNAAAISIHMANQQLDADKEYDFYSKWCADTADTYNACLILGEVECVGDCYCSEDTMRGLCNMLETYKDTHHFFPCLFFGHSDEVTHAHIWKDYAKQYITETAE